MIVDCNEVVESRKARNSGIWRSAKIDVGRREHWEGIGDSWVARTDRIANDVRIIRAFEA